MNPRTRRLYTVDHHNILKEKHITHSIFIFISIYCSYVLESRSSRVVALVRVLAPLGLEGPAAAAEGEGDL